MYQELASKAPSISQQIEKSGGKKKRKQTKQTQMFGQAKAVIPADTRMPFALRKVSPLIDRLRQGTR
jgi:hypothetical protein